MVDSAVVQDAQVEAVAQNHTGVQEASARDNILAMESAIGAAPQVEMRVEHHFSKGLYARELHIPKGTLLVGKIHRFENLNIISQGEISVYTEEGIRRIKAPCTIVSPPGTKRVGYAHEDTVWTTIHATEETDIEAIEKIVIADDFGDPALPEQIARLLKEE